MHAFFNGFNNSGTLVAAPISTRSLPPRVAIGIALMGEFAGPFVFGVAVAATIGRDFLEISEINLNVLLAAAVAVISWNALTWFFGFPSSSSHALAGGLIGASLIAAGLGVFKIAGLVKILGGLLLSPALGLVGGYLLLKIILALVQSAPPGINFFFRHLQGLTTLALAMGHGTNDGQKSMGLITLGLVVLRIQNTFVVPTWVTLAVAIAMCLGVVSGGYRIIRTLGGKIYQLRPVHGFTAQLAASAIVITAALVGAPVATTHIAGTTIMGVGAAERARGVRWGVAGQIMMAWLVTIPAVAVLAAIIYLVLDVTGI
ncbi:MAG: inorganic phosphate transporter [Anaerolineae bacterium]